MKLLTRKEAAEFLRISIRKLDDLAATGMIPYCKIGDGSRSRVVYELRDIEEFIENSRSKYSTKLAS